MKKFISVALATAMIASMSVSAFAKSDYKYDVKDIKVDWTPATNAKKETGVCKSEIGYYDVTKAIPKNAVGNSEAISTGKVDYTATSADKIAEFMGTKYAEKYISAEDKALVALAAGDLGVTGTYQVNDKISTDDIAIIKALDVKSDYVTANGCDHTDMLYFPIGVKATAEDKNKSGYKADFVINGVDYLYVSDSDNYDDIEDIDDLKLSIKYTSGSQYVADQYIDEIDDSDCSVWGASDVYAVVIELKDNYTTSKQKIKGEITLKAGTKKVEDEHAFSYNYRVSTATIENGSSTDINKVEECEFDGEDVYINLVEFNDVYDVAKFTKDVENIELEDDNGFYFNVKASDQGKLNLNYDNVAVKSVARLAPVDADLTFYNFYGEPSFDFTGKVTITPEEDDVEYFLYRINADGTLSLINTKANEDGDAIEFKTRTLGQYVLSDMELEVAGDVEEETTTDAPTTDEGVKENPGTGC